MIQQLVRLRGDRTLREFHNDVQNITGMHVSFGHFCNMLSGVREIGPILKRYMDLKENGPIRPLEVYDRLREMHAVLKLIPPRDDAWEQQALDGLHAMLYLAEWVFCISNDDDGRDNKNITHYLNKQEVEDIRKFLSGLERRGKPNG